jgi:hypothetical protein
MNFITKIYNGIKSREPVTTTALIRILLATAIMFGWIHLTVAQLAQILIAVEAFLSYWLKGQVYTSSVHNEVVTTALSLPSDSTRKDLSNAIIAKREEEKLQ